MRRRRLLWAIALVVVAGCSKHSSELAKDVEMQCFHLQEDLEHLSADFHKALTTGESTPGVLSPSTRVWEARVVESAHLHARLVACTQSRVLNPSEDARVSKALSGVYDQYRSSKLEDASAAVDQMLAELEKLNAAPLRD